MEKHICDVTEKSTNQVGVVLDLCDEAGVDDLQDHPQNLLKHCSVRESVAQRRLVADVWKTNFEMFNLIIKLERFFPMSNDL